MERSTKQKIRRGRRERRAARIKKPVKAQAYIKRKIPLSEMCSEDGLTTLENNADTILQEIGIEFKGDQEILDLLRNAGAEVCETRVKFERGMLRELIKTAPAEYKQYARNQAVPWQSRWAGCPRI